MAESVTPQSRKLIRAKLRHSTFIDPKTALRSKRSFILHENDLGSNGTHVPEHEDPGPLTGLGILEAPPTKWERVKTVIRERSQTCWQFATSDLGKGMFKCALAYLLGSLYTYIPFFNFLLDRVDSKHVAATVTVYFHPARTRGSALKALVVASMAFMYTATIGLTSMAVSVFFIDHLGQVVIAHTIVLILFVWGGLGFVGWVKLTRSDPLINIACSLTNLSLISVLTKEGAVQAGDLSFGKIGQYLKMIVAGVLASTAVSLLVFPVSARHLLRKNLVHITDSMSDMLGLITSSFISGDEAQLEGEKFTSVGETQRQLSSTLNANLSDARIELNVRGLEAEAQILARMVECVQQLNQDIGGLRSAASMQFIVVKQPHPLSGITDRARTELLSSMATTPARTPNPERFSSSSLSFDQIAGSKTPTMPDDDTDAGPGTKGARHHRSTEQIFELFIDNLGPSMRSLAFTMKEILDELPFDPEDNFAVANNPRFRISLERAIALYKEARKAALEIVYDKKNIDRNRPVEVEADWEEAAACCGQFSFCLLSVAEQIKEYLVTLDDLEAELISRPDGRTWEWLKFWKRKSHRTKVEDTTLLQPKPSVDRVIATEYGIQRVKPKHNAYEQSVRAGTVQMDLKQRVLRKVYETFSFWRHDDKKYFLKVGFGAMLYALPSFLSATRPVYTKWRGEWGLLSYMLVCCMTIGASNTTGWQRSWGTCLGALLAISSWHICRGHALPMAIFGFFMAYWTAYVILGMGKGPLGRFIMLTYNLSALYAYNVLLIDEWNKGRRESSDSLNIEKIALHRTVAVLSGCVWGLFITRTVWPISARRKLKDGLSILWLRMALIWKHDPLAVFFVGESNEAYMNLRNEIDLQAFVAKLNALVGASRNEFVMRRPFPADTYNRILRLCSRMLDAFHQMHIVLNRDLTPSAGEKALLEATVHERDQLCGRLSHQFSVLASSMKLEYSLANDALPSIEHTRDRLLAKIFTYRRADADAKHTSDEDYSLLYSYALVTGQIARQIQACLKEIESLFGVLDEESLWLQ